MMKAVIRNTESLWRMFSKFADENGEQFEKAQLVEITEFKPKRSLSQNAKLHCMIRALADHIGYSESELKMWLKLEHGPKKRVQVGDVDKVIPLSTAEFNKGQMMAFMDTVDRLCAENGVYVDMDSA